MLLAADLKEKISGQNVVPLVFTMMNVPRRTKLRRRAQLEDGTCAAAVFAGHLAGGELSELLGCKLETAFAGVGHGDALFFEFGFSREQRRCVGNTKDREQTPA